MVRAVFSKDGPYGNYFPGLREVLKDQVLFFEVLFSWSQSAAWDERSSGCTSGCGFLVCSLG